jgi:phosphoglycolate phosphatase-like HAD superfamily hydrolase
VIPTLAKKKVFVFDWDGTLFDSMSAKTVSFAEVMSDWLEQKNNPMPASEVARLYRLYSGAPRRVIFQKIAQDAGTRAEAEDCAAMSDALFARNRVALGAASLFEDAMPCLEGLLAQGRTLCLSSSVPQDELSHFVSRKVSAPVRGQFAAVLGSQPDLAKGPGHLGAIRALTAAAAGDVIVIGDDVADRDLSTEAGIDSILIDRDRHLPSGTPHISSLTEITRIS